MIKAPHPESEDPGTGTKKDKKGKGPVKVKLEDDDHKAFMKNIADALEAINVNLADNRKPR